MPDAEAPQNTHIRTYAQDLAAARKARGRQAASQRSRASAEADPSEHTRIATDAGSKLAAPTRSVSGHHIQPGDTPDASPKSSATATPASKKVASTPASNSTSTTQRSAAAVGKQGETKTATTPPPIPRVARDNAPTTQIPAFHEVDQSKSATQSTAKSKTKAKATTSTAKEARAKDAPQKPASPDSLWKRIIRWFTGGTSSATEASTVAHEPQKDIVQKATTKTGTQFTADSDQLKDLVRKRQQTTSAQPSNQTPQPQPTTNASASAQSDNAEESLTWSPYAEPGYPLLEGDAADPASPTISNVRVTPKRTTQPTPPQTPSTRPAQSPRWESEATPPATETPERPATPTSSSADEHERRWGSVSTTEAEVGSTTTPQSRTAPTPVREAPQPDQTRSQAAESETSVDSPTTPDRTPTTDIPPTQSPAEERLPDGRPSPLVDSSFGQAPTTSGTAWPTESDGPTLDLGVFLTPIKQFFIKLRALDTNALTLALLIGCTITFVVVVGGQAAWNTFQDNNQNQPTEPEQMTMLRNADVRQMQLPATDPHAAIRQATQDANEVTEFVIVTAEETRVPVDDIFTQLELEPGSPVVQSIEDVRFVSTGDSAPLLLIDFVDIDTVRGGFFAWETTMVNELSTMYRYAPGTVSFSDAVVAGVDVRVARVNGETSLLYGFLDEGTLLIAPDTASFATVATRSRAE